MCEREKSVYGFGADLTTTWRRENALSILQLFSQPNHKTLQPSPLCCISRTQTRWLLINCALSLNEYFFESSFEAKFHELFQGHPPFATLHTLSIQNKLLLTIKLSGHELSYTFKLCYLSHSNLVIFYSYKKMAFVSPFAKTFPSFSLSTFVSLFVSSILLPLI